MHLLAEALIAFSLIAVSTSISEQSISARGQLYCGSIPMVGATIKLWELDTWPDPDDLLATTTTDDSGRFHIRGTEWEFAPIQPVLKIYRKCNTCKKGTKCYRKLAFKLPEAYISAKTSYDLGVLNLEAVVVGEKERCFYGLESLGYAA